MDAVFAAGQRAVRDLGYKIDAIDRANGLLNFKTGMSWSSWAGQEMSVMFVENGDGTIEVSVSGRRNQSGVVLQVYDWGEAKKIANWVLANVDKFVNETPAAPVKIAQVATTTTPATRDERECPFCAETILKKAKVCKHCGRDVLPPSDRSESPPIAPHQNVHPLPTPEPDPPQIQLPETDEEFFESLGLSDDFSRQSVDSKAPPRSSSPLSARPPDTEFAMNCPCGARLKVKSHLVGKTVPCPKCQNPLKVQRQDQ